MKPEEYFPRLPGKEPFLPPFTGAAKPEKKMVEQICGKCGEHLGEVEVTSGDKSHGLCPKCARTYYWEKDGEESSE